MDNKTSTIASQNIFGENFSVKSNSRIYNFPEVLSLANNYLSFLNSKGLQAGEYAAIVSENSVEFIIAILAIWQIGSIPVLINTRLTKNEIEKQISFCKIVLISEAQEKKFKSFALPTFKISLSSKLNSDSNYCPPELNKAAVIIFTSGSTDEPKAVEHSFKSLYQSFVSGNKFLTQSKLDKWLASLPFYHIGGFSIFTRSLFSGCLLVIPQDISDDTLEKNILEEHPTLISLVTPQLKRLIEKNISPNTELRIALLGGGMIDTELVETGIRLGWQIYKVYGSTETASFVSILNPFEFEIKKKSVGKAVFNNLISICDEMGNALPANTIGEIVISGRSLFTKYLFNAEATSQKLKNGVYYSGDIGFIDEEGYLFIDSRRTDLIVTGGENVNPAEIESVIKKFPGVKEVCVFGVVDSKWGQKINAAIVSEKEIGIDIEILKAFLKLNLADFKIPKEFYFSQSLPKSPLGKILRDKTAKMYSA